MTEYRIEKDSLGEVQVPVEAYYGAQTQRAINNDAARHQQLSHQRTAPVARLHLEHGDDQAGRRRGQSGVGAA